jgi:LmbE family N-acetylglucosaminyl deacetylase
VRHLVIAAHPDDEVLGAGGTIAAASRAGDEVHVLVLSEGVSLLIGRGPSSIEEARARCVAAGQVLGAADVTFGGFGSDGLMCDGKQSEVVAVISSALGRVGPHQVLTHHGGDVHADHRLVAESTVWATRAGTCAGLAKVMQYEVPSSTEQQRIPSLRFAPNLYVDISETLPVKQAALNAYADEMRDYPHGRSFRALEAQARFRGIEAGYPMAEAFCVIRESVRYGEAAR